MIPFSCVNKLGILLPLMHSGIHDLPLNCDAIEKK